jgi:hypothetical protein
VAALHSGVMAVRGRSPYSPGGPIAGIAEDSGSIPGLAIYISPLTTYTCKTHIIPCPPILGHTTIWPEVFYFVPYPSTVLVYRLYMFTINYKVWTSRPACVTEAPDMTIIIPAGAH